MAEDNNVGRIFGIATTSKLYLNGLTLHQMIFEILLDYTSDFEMIVSMLIGELEEQRTNIRCKNLDDFENYKNAIGGDYDSAHVVFAECL